MKTPFNQPCGCCPICASRKRGPHDCPHGNPCGFGGQGIECIECMADIPEPCKHRLREMKYEARADDERAKLERNAREAK